MFKKNRCFKGIVLALVIAVLAINLTGCGGSKAAVQQEQRDYFKVGVITSLSGADVYGGSVTKRGYDMWADTVNSKGGIKIGDKSYRVQLVYADDQSDPGTAADAAQRMVTSDKVDFVLGPYTSAITLAVAPIFDKYKIPMITGSAEGPQVWKQKFQYTFGTIPAINLTCVAPVKLLARDVNPKPKTMAIIGLNDPGGKAMTETFKATAEKEGIKVVKYDSVPVGTDFTPLISAIKSLDPDILTVGGHGKELMEIVKASKSLGFMPKLFLMHYGITTPEFTESLGKDADYAMDAVVWTPDVKHEDPLFGSTQDYVKAFETKWGSTPDYTEAACSATGEVFAAALTKINAVPPLSEEQRVNLVKALEEVKVDTFYGPIKFATSGEWYHNNTGLEPLIIQMVKGKQIIVGPENQRQQAPVYPVTPFNQR